MHVLGWHARIVVLHARIPQAGSEKDGYPDSVTALLKAAGVLHAVPLHAGTYVHSSDDQFTLPNTPRFQFSENGAL